MRMPVRIVVAALVAMAVWTSTTQAQSRGDDGAKADGIPPQLQTDTQRQAARARRDMQRQGTQAPLGPRQAGEPRAGSDPAAPTARGVDGNAVVTGLATMAAIDVLNAAAGAATNAILKSDDEPYPLRGNGNSGDAGPGQAWPADGQPARYP